MKGEVEQDDVMLAIHLNATTSFVPPPGQDVRGLFPPLPISRQQLSKVLFPLDPHPSKAIGCYLL